MGDIRVYRQPSRERYVTKKGEVHYYANSTTQVYRCKLHHPDSAEMEAIRAELARGDTKKAVAVRHRLGATPQRLNRLLARVPPLGAAAVPAGATGGALTPPAVTPAADAPAAAPALSDAELDALLAGAGWA